MQYISDEKGKITAVIVPISMWKEISAQKETIYLLKSPAMKERLSEARDRKDGLSIDYVREELDI